MTLARSTALQTSSGEIETVHGRIHTAETVDRALLTIAMTGGNVTKAHELLTNQGIKVAHTTLKEWRASKYPNRYRALAARHSAEIEQSVVSSVRELVLRASTVAYQAVELEEQRIAAGDIKDASGSARNLATTVGIAVDKMLLIDGRPNQIVETRSSDDVLRSLEAKGFIVDATAEEDDGPDTGGVREPRRPPPSTPPTTTGAPEETPVAATGR